MHADHEGMQPSMTAWLHMLAECHNNHTDQCCTNTGVAHMQCLIIIILISASVIWCSRANLKQEAVLAGFGHGFHGPEILPRDVTY